MRRDLETRERLVLFSVKPRGSLSAPASGWTEVRQSSGLNERGVPDAPSSAQNRLQRDQEAAILCP